MGPNPAINKSRKPSDGQSIVALTTTVQTLINAHNVANANLIRMVDKYKEMKKEIVDIREQLLQLSDATLESAKIHCGKIAELETKVMLLDKTCGPKK